MAESRKGGLLLIGSPAPSVRSPPLGPRFLPWDESHAGALGSVRSPWCAIPGESTFNETGRLRTLPFQTAGAENTATLFPQQRRVLERRAGYVRVQLARDREAGRGNRAGDELDPVLRAHLGLG